MNNIDPTGSQKPTKEEIVGFFCKSGFLKVSRVAKNDDSEDED
jgi:hypothetical protein